MNVKKTSSSNKIIKIICFVLYFVKSLLFHFVCFTFYFNAFSIFSCIFYTVLITYFLNKIIDYIFSDRFLLLLLEHSKLICTIIAIIPSWFIARAITKAIMSNLLS
ncbi:MAG: hypothetical protein WJU30_00139 [Candidatus Phytoplasma pruni]